MHSCGRGFGDDDRLHGSQAFSPVYGADAENDTDYGFFFFFSLFVSGYLCSAVSFHYIMPSFMFSISSPSTFGLLRSSVGLYPLIDFPIESEARERRGTDSIHCFHLYDTMMISPAAACQPPLASLPRFRLHRLRSCC